jgi:DNA helicase-2/ATP-dependent DNA helicase PcrA
MDAPHLLAPLNDAQRLAVAAPLAPTLVLAGAGSGKTRVLTHRVAWLVETGQVSPHGVLAVTFTNKAAGEMRARIEALLRLPSAPLWIGTFHGIAHRLLRLHWREAGLPQGFQILDDDDQQRLVKKLLKEQNKDESTWVPREVQSFINSNKDEGRRAKQLADRGEPTRREFIRLYEQYEKRCQQLGVVDFAELLLRAYEVLRDQPALRASYQRRFRHVLIDEFQDTNVIQYEWIRLVCGSEGLPFVVGDDDQSIYRWRGARVENMQHFQRDYPGVQLFRLEQNYRSTGTILRAANEVIRLNEARLGKELWTSAGRGDPIRLFCAYNERDEADFVVQRIREHLNRGGRRDECALLYRSNAQSRTLEEALMAARIPYRVYGGLRFFERAEIKDALAYLRLVQNPADDVSFERVVNVPARGIGQASMERLRELARERAAPLGSVAADALAQLGPKAAGALHAFLVLLDRLRNEIAGQPLHEQVRVVIELSGLREHHAKEKDNKGEARVENLDELVNAAESFSLEPGSEMTPLESFLAHAVLESGETQAGEGTDHVQLMTLHAAKGLEFPLVCMVGMEQGLFPSERSISDPDRLAEERRLCYVGITRAMRQLYLSHAETRRLYGRTEPRVRSSFVDEIPADALEEVRPRMNLSRPLYVPERRAAGDRLGGSGEGNGRGYGRRGDSFDQRPEANYRLTPPVPARPRPAPVPGEPKLPFRLGARVRHTRFGDGVVLSFEESGSDLRVQVNFERQGMKWLIMKYANLTAV